MEHFTFNFYKNKIIWLIRVNNYISRDIGNATDVMQLNNNVTENRTKHILTITKTHDLLAYHTLLQAVM